MRMDQCLLLSNFFFLNASLMLFIIQFFRKQGPYSHDIALLKLKTKGDGCGARYTKTVSPICLPDPWSKFSENTTCIVSGWGKTKSKFINLMIQDCK